MVSFKEHSKTNFTEEQITHEGVRTGALQRIADACEIMAKDRQQLTNDVNYWKRTAEQRLDRILELEKEIKNLKSVKSRYKNQLKKFKSDGENS